MRDLGKHLLQPAPEATERVNGLDPTGIGQPAPSRPSNERPGDERAHLRDALHLVLSLGVYDSAGRAVTVQDMLRGSLATAVRVALNGKRAG